MLIDYTSYDNIRAVLSVTAGELEDSTLELPIFFTTLQDELEEVSPTLQGAYEALLPVDEASYTAAEAKFYRRVQLFAAYSVARQLLDSIALLAVKSEQDARAQYERFEAPFARVEANVRATYALARQRVGESYAALGGVIASKPARTYSSAAGLGTDPVVG